MLLAHTQSHHDQQPGTAIDQPDEQRVADLRQLDRRIAETSRLLRKLRAQRDAQLEESSAATQSAYLASRMLEVQEPTDVTPITFVPADDLSQETCTLDDAHLAAQAEAHRLRAERLEDFRHQRQLAAARRISPREQREMETIQAAHESHQRRLAEDATEPGRDYME